MPAYKNDYATLSTPGSKKVSVIARRAGSRERMNVIAVCNTEYDAERIVGALDLMQGKLKELELPVQKTLDQLRGTLDRELTAGKAQAVKIRELENKLREKSNEIERLRYDLHRAQIARDDAQKAAREHA